MMNETLNNLKTAVITGILLGLTFVGLFAVAMNIQKVKITTTDKCRMVGMVKLCDITETREPLF